MHSACAICLYLITEIDKFKKIVKLQSTFNANDFGDMRIERFDKLASKVKLVFDEKKSWGLIFLVPLVKINSKWYLIKRNKTVKIGQVIGDLSSSVYHQTNWTTSDVDFNCSEWQVASLVNSFLQKTGILKLINFNQTFGTIRQKQPKDCFGIGHKHTNCKLQIWYCLFSFLYWKMTFVASSIYM